MGRGRVSAATRELDARWAESHAETTAITNVHALRRLARLSRGAAKVERILQERLAAGVRLTDVEFRDALRDMLRGDDA